MKEFTYLDLKDYLDKADKYDEPKTIKMYQITRDSQGRTCIKAVVYLRTALICWSLISESPDELADTLIEIRDHGHAQGRIAEVAPAIRMG